MVAVAAVACGPKGPKEYHVSESAPADLGTIKEIDGPVSFKLLVFNNYKDTLYPKMIYTPCGCTSAKPQQKGVAPGEDEVIEVTYNPAYRPGEMHEQIIIHYENSPVRVRRVGIKGTVIGYNHPIEESCRYNMGLDFYSSHKKLGFGGMTQGQTKDMFFRYGNGGKRKAKVEFVIPEQWQPYIRIKQPGVLKVDQRDTTHVKLTFPVGADSVSFTIQPLVNGKPTDETIMIHAVPSSL